MKPFALALVVIGGLIQAIAIIAAIAMKQPGTPVSWTTLALLLLVGSAIEALGVVFQLSVGRRTIE